MKDDLIQCEDEMYSCEVNCLLFPYFDNLENYYLLNKLFIKVFTMQYMKYIIF